MSDENLNDVFQWVCLAITFLIALLSIVLNLINLNLHKAVREILKEMNK